MIKALFLALLALNFAHVDRIHHDATSPADYRLCRAELEKMLPQAEDDAERAEVHWRIARQCYLLEDFNGGMKQAQEAIRLNPSNEHAYMWHCANAGRECLLHNLAYQAKVAGTLEKDLTIILDKLGKSDYSEAWHALAELYSSHPFKSNDAAINFMRRTVVTIPDGERRLIAYKFLSDLLYERNWPETRRARQREDHKKGYADKSKGNIARYACYDAAPAETWPWKVIGQTDREEALSILLYARDLYQKDTRHHPVDTKTYNLILQKLESWK